MMHIKTRRILASFLSTALLFTSAPSWAYAAETEDQGSLTAMQEEPAALGEETAVLLPEEPAAEQELLNSSEEPEEVLEEEYLSVQEDVPEEEYLVAADDGADEETEEELTIIPEEDLTGLIEDPEAEGTLSAAEDNSGYPEPHYDREWDRHMLPGWDGTVDGSYNVRVWDEDHPDGEDRRYEVIEVEKKSDEPANGGTAPVVDDFHRDEDQNDPNHYWWYYHVQNPGEAELEVTYKDLNGEEQSYTFVLYVGSDAYSVYMNSTDGRHTALPGGEIELYADAQHYYQDENGEQRCDAEGLDYVWLFEEGADYAGITVDESDPSRATLKFNALPQEQDWISGYIRVGVRVLDQDGNETEAYNAADFWVECDYCEVVPQILDRNLEVGDSLSAQMAVRRYRQGEESYQNVEEEVSYEWHYDENAIRVTPKDGESNTYTITRLKGWETDISVRAYWEEDEQPREVWGNYHFLNKDYGIWFEEHDLNMYSDAASPEPLILDVGSLGEGWEDRLDLELTVGHWGDSDNWADNLTENQDYTVVTQDDLVMVTLTGAYLASLEDYDNVRVRAEVYLKDAEQNEDNRICDTDAWFHIEKARSEYDFEWDEITMLPGWDHKIDRWQWARVWSSSVPEGEWEGHVEITNVESSDTSVADIEYYEWDNDDGKDHNWAVRAKSRGTAAITLTYRDWDNTEKQYPFTVSVSGERYDLNVWTQEDTETVLPGGSIVLRAQIWHHLNDPKTGENWDESDEEIAEKLHYVWSIRGDEQSQKWIKTIEYPEGGENGNTATVVLNDLPVDWGDRGLWEDLFIEVRAVSKTDPTDIKADNVQRIVISNDYYELWAPGFDGDLWPGESVNVTPQLRRYPSRDGSELGYDVITDGVTFEWDYDENAAEVTEKGDGSVTIRKLTEWDSEIKVRAYFQNDNGDPEDREWNGHFQDINTDFWFETPGGNNIFTDGARTAELNLENYEDAPAELYELEYEVKAWFPKDESLMDWEEQSVSEELGWSVSGSDLESRVIFDGAKLAQLCQSQNVDHYKVYASIVFGDYVIENREQDYWLREPGFNHYDGVSFGDGSMFPGDSRTLNGYYDGSRIRLNNSAFPEGKALPFVITGVSSENVRQDPDDPRNAVGVEPYTDDSGRICWRLTAVRPGEAQITLTLNILDETTLDDPSPMVISATQVTYRIWVGDFQAHFDTKTSTGSRNLLAGQSIQILPELFVYRQNEYGGVDELNPDDYIIELEAYTEEVYEDGHDNWGQQGPVYKGALTNENGSWYLTADADSPEQRVRIYVTAYDYDRNRDYGEDNRWEIAYQDLDIEVSDCVNVLETAGWNENMMTGETVTVTPTVKTYISGSDTGEDYESEDLFYRFENDESEFEITYNEETGSFTVKRLADWDTGFDVAAFDKDMRGNEFEVARVRLYVNRESYPATLVGKEGRGDNWNTWFYSNETDISVSPDLSALSALDSDKLTVELTYGRQDYTSTDGLKLNPLKNYEYDEATDSWIATGTDFLFGAGEWSGETGLDLSSATQERRDQIAAILGQQDGGFHIRLRVLYGDGEDKRTLADELMWVELRLATKELEDDEATTIVGRDFYYDGGKSLLYVEDADHCSGNDRDGRDGKYYEVTITGITSDNESVLKPEYDESTGNRRLEAVGEGSALITYTYTYADDNGDTVTGTHTATLHVADAVYYLDLGDGNYFGDYYKNVLADGTETISPTVMKRTYNQDKADAGDEDPYDWTKLADSLYDVSYICLNDRFITVAKDNTDAVITASGMNGETNIDIFVSIYNDDAHTDCVWEMQRTAVVNVVTAEASLDLSEETVYAVPGDEISMADLREDFMKHYKTRSLSDPEWKTPADTSRSEIWFLGEPDSYLGMTLSDPGYDTDYQKIKIAADILEQAQGRGWLDKDGTYTAEVRVAVVRDVTQENWLFTDTGLNVVIHEHSNHVTETPEVPATYTSEGHIGYWTCSVCGKHFSDEACTTEVSQEVINTPIPVKPAEGTAEENLEWSIKDGVLTVSAADSQAAAKIPSYTDADAAPWAEAAKQLEAAGKPVTRVAVSEGVTEIGDNAFSGLTGVKNIALPKSLTEISGSAFDSSVAGNAEISYAGTESQWASLTSGTNLANAKVKAVHEHAWSAWKKVSDATVFAKEKQRRTCSCGKSEEREVGNKLTPTITLTATSIPLKTKQATTKIVVSNLAKGDSVKSWSSSNTKLVTVTQTGALTCKIKAGKKTGTAKITVTLASGKTEVVTVKVQKKKVTTKKVKVVSKKITLAKGQTYTILPTITPITTTDKLSCTSSNKKVAKVTKKGVITAKKAGKAKITVKSGKKKVVITVTVQ